MPKRSKKGKSNHDKAVSRSAEWYKGQGFKVKADIKGWKKPKTIGGYIPDLIAKKGKKEIVLEVETPQTVEKDHDQWQAFKEYADRKRQREARKKIV
ncbi:MAG: hypothetical protein U9R38_08200 [Candidatus Margulisiibacteriota bacterium]|nr:hypothetical protein [Candidatus Margulisiibacteriota bacterium]